jgi:hypothetical protein
VICARCGADNPEQDRICRSCGLAMSDQKFSVADAQAYEHGLCKEAVWSLIMAVFGLFLGSTFIQVIGAGVAVVTGIIALWNIRHSGGFLRGRFLAIAGLVLGSLILVLAPMFAYAKHFSDRERAKELPEAVRLHQAQESGRTCVPDPPGAPPTGGPTQEASSQPNSVGQTGKPGVAQERRP